MAMAVPLPEGQYYWLENSRKSALWAVHVACSFLLDTACRQKFNYNEMVHTTISLASQDCCFEISMLPLLVQPQDSEAVFFPNVKFWRALFPAVRRFRPRPPPRPATAPDLYS